MKRRHHTPDQIIWKLAEGRKLLAEGQEVAKVARYQEVIPATPYRWLNQHGGMKADDAKKLKEFEGAGLGWPVRDRASEDVDDVLSKRRLERAANGTTRTWAAST